MTHVIDLDKVPDWIQNFINKGVTPGGAWRELKIHVKGGQFVWSLERVKLLAITDREPNCFRGHYQELKKELDGLPVFNVCLMDFWLENQSLIPKEWRSKEILFWGTHMFHFWGYMSGMVVFAMRFDGEKWAGYEWSGHCQNLVVPIMLNEPKGCD